MCRDEILDLTLVHMVEEEWFGKDLFRIEKLVSCPFLI
jgi:hypothetical protein